MGFNKEYLPFILFALLGIFYFIVQIKKPSKNQRIYAIIQEYNPYYHDRRFGSLQLLTNKDPNFTGNLKNLVLYKQFKKLERAWGEKHLKIDQDQLIILDDNGTVLSKVILETEDEKTFLHDYYGI
jgi:hypothetical protein